LLQVAGSLNNNSTKSKADLCPQLKRNYLKDENAMEGSQEEPGN